MAEDRAAREIPWFVDVADSRPEKLEMKGWVYIATMTNTIGVVKIGYTDRDPDVRVLEWSRDTGAPGVAEVKYAALVDNPRVVEKAIHRSLSSYRQLNSEWFQCGVDDAVVALKEHADVLFEDDRIAAAADAKQKKLEKDIERRHERELQRKKQEEEHKERTRRASLQRKTDEKKYLYALAKWEERPQESFIDHIWTALGSAFVVSIAAVIALGVLEIDSWGVFFTLVVPATALIIWVSTKTPERPRLKGFVTEDDKAAAEQHSARERELSSDPALKTMRSGVAYEHALAKWKQKEPDGATLFCLFWPISTMLWLAFLYFLLRWESGGAMFLVAASVSFVGSIWVIRLLKNSHQDRRPKPRH